MHHYHLWRRNLIFYETRSAFAIFDEGARTYALTETTNYGLPLVTRLCLVMLLLEALPPVKPGGRASKISFPGRAWERAPARVLG